MVWRAAKRPEFLGASRGEQPAAEESFRPYRLVGAYAGERMTAKRQLLIDDPSEFQVKAITRIRADPLRTSRCRRCLKVKFHRHFPMHPHATDLVIKQQVKVAQRTTAIGENLTTSDEADPRRMPEPKLHQGFGMVAQAG